MKEEKLNLSLLCDFYELTMGNGYLKAGYQDRITYFDVFFRDVPDGGGFAIAAGLEQIIDYIQDLRFTPEDIDFLRGKGAYTICMSLTAASFPGGCTTSTDGFQTTDAAAMRCRTVT